LWSPPWSCSPYVSPDDVHPGRRSTNTPPPPYPIRAESTSRPVAAPARELRSVPDSSGRVSSRRLKPRLTLQVRGAQGLVAGPPASIGRPSPSLVIATAPGGPRIGQSPRSTP